MKKLIAMLAVAMYVEAPMLALTKIQMQSVAVAVTNAGYSADLITSDGTTWSVRARSGNMDVPIATANNLAVAQSVSAFIAEIEYGPMDLAKMQAVSTAITNAGYNATSSQVSPGSWKVRASSSNIDIPTSSAASLATSQAVAGMVSEVEYR